VSRDLAEYVVDQVSSLGEVTVKAMFSSWGLYLDGRFFAIANDGVLYLKTDSETAVKYRELGMEPFSPSQDQVLKNYLEVPADILDDRERLMVWVEEAAGL